MNACSLVLLHILVPQLQAIKHSLFELIFSSLNGKKINANVPTKLFLFQQHTICQALGVEHKIQLALKNYPILLVMFSYIVHYVFITTNHKKYLSALVNSHTINLWFQKLSYLQFSYNLN